MKQNETLLQKRDETSDVAGQGGDFVFEQNQEFLERFDSRGKKIRIRRGQITHPVLEKIGYSFATINFHPNALIT